MGQLDVVKKLGCTIHSVNNILQDPLLCKRILEEEVLTIAKAQKLYNKTHAGISQTIGRYEVPTFRNTPKSGIYFFKSDYEKRVFEKSSQDKMVLYLSEIRESLGKLSTLTIPMTELHFLEQEKKFLQDEIKLLRAELKGLNEQKGSIITFTDAPFRPIVLRKISSIDLGPRLSTALIKLTDNGTVADALKISILHLSKVPNIGASTLREWEDFIRINNLQDYVHERKIAKDQ